ncbi:FAD-dependent oxidoreductase [Streptosporangium sp. NBC_01756]|uniref:FAD-dependent oxidoreductase n=1 Tax=Streptosporangium sp. NBC_01756 TaxID=2975950 RepID=UPI002DD95229|nr:FAD-dependent oxidoreductase [Streptosporangium sp. NBC_01756]WSC90337.1 FAD-dependent oxidoreductase [Streptosporangium sp. NBC_01756]
MLPATTDVLVIGAGPTGLTVALSLAGQGFDVTVADNQAAGDNTSRAAVVHARTLEVLEPLGVSERLAAQGIHASQFTIKDRDRTLVPVRFDRLPTRYPYTLMISQAVTERILLERLVELGGRVARPYTLESLTQDGEGVSAVFAEGGTVRAKYVVGADGMHSTVREQAAVAFTGGQYAESFSLADVRLTGGVPDDEVILFFSPTGLVVVAPLPDGTHRIVATVDEAPAEPDAAFVQALLDGRGPQRDRAVVREVVWGSRFRVHHRVADAYRVGRVVLAGDAAHVHSPAGGQGMNTGIQDATALGEALLAALKGDQAALDVYATTRRPVAERVISLAGRLTRLATVNRRLRPIRNLALRILARNPGFRNGLAMRLSGLVYR